MYVTKSTGVQGIAMCFLMMSLDLLTQCIEQQLDFLTCCSRDIILYVCILNSQARPLML